MEELNTNGTSVYDYIVSFRECEHIKVEKEKQTININIYICPSYPPMVNPYPSIPYRCYSY